MCLKSFTFFFIAFPFLSFSQTQCYSGVINNKSEMTMMVKVMDEGVKGLYYFNSERKFIKIGTVDYNAATISDNHHICLTITDKDLGLLNESGFCGKIYKEGFKGAWYDQDNSYPFKLESYIEDKHIYKHENEKYDSNWVWNQNEKLNKKSVTLAYIIDDYYVFDYSHLIYEELDDGQVVIESEEHKEGVLFREGNKFYKCDLDKIETNGTPALSIENNKLYFHEYGETLFVVKKGN